MDDYIIDCISGKQVKGTPEEIEAVQPFSKNWLRIILRRLSHGYVILEIRAVIFSKYKKGCKQANTNTEKNKVSVLDHCYLNKRMMIILITPNSQIKSIFMQFCLAR